MRLAPASLLLAMATFSPTLAFSQVPTGAATATAPLQVWVDARGASFDAEKLRASLSKELKRDVRLTTDAGAASVRIRLEGEQRADVRYTTPSGEELSRNVDLPPDRERAAQVVSWLTVNLVRDEASELIRELRERRKEQADARAAEEQATADRAAAEEAAAKAAADKAAAEEAAADEAERKRAEQAKKDENGAGGPQAQVDADGLLRDPKRTLDLAFITPLSIIYDSPQRLMHFQLALLYGESGGMRGVGVSTGVLRVRKDLQGALVAPGVALVGGKTRGVVVSAGYAQVDDVLTGVVIAPGAAVQRGKTARGVVVAGGGTITGELMGVTLGAGFASAKSVQGAAVAGGITLTRGTSRGALVAGGVNFSSDHTGVEVAGGVNIARDLNGVALAPVNFHRRVKGLQLGVVNIAEEVDGASVGVISYAKNGRLQPVLWTSTDGSAHLAVKSIAGWAFTQIGAGIDVNGETFSYDGGVGPHFKVTQNVFCEPGVHYSGTHSTKDASGAPDEHQLHYLAQFGYRVGDVVDFLGAAGLRHTVAGGSGAKLVPELRAGIAFF